LGGGGGGGGGVTSIRFNLTLGVKLTVPTR